MAVALVIIRGNQNEGVVPPPAPSVAGPGGVPRYYAAVVPEVRVGGFGLLVGDTRTGQTLANIRPPAHMSYASVTAAADDRTFVAFATSTGGSGMNGRWYMLHLAPGTAHVVSLTSTPIHPQSGVRASALSGSGTLLAVAENGALQRVLVFSVATGRPLRIWSTKAAPDLWTSSSTQQNYLTWIDGSRPLLTIGTTYTTDADFSCEAAQGWQPITVTRGVEAGQGVICGGGEKSDLPQAVSGTASPSAASSAGDATCTPRNQPSIGFLESTADGLGESYLGLTAGETECPATAQAGDGAYIGWSNADGSVLVGSLAWDGRARFGIFRGSRFTPLPALLVAVPEPAGAPAGMVAW